MVEQPGGGGQPPRYEFLVTLHCHLCEEAARVLSDVLPVDGITVLETDIAHSDSLVAQYGERIPVLRRLADGAELHWPFSQPDVRAFTE